MEIQLTINNSITQPELMNKAYKYRGYLTLCLELMCYLPVCPNEKIEEFVSRSYIPIEDCIIIC